MTENRRLDPLLPSATAVLTAFTLFLGGCAGSAGTNFRNYDGTRTLPTTRTILSPDSLHFVELVLSTDSVNVALAGSYAALMREWSAQVQSNGPFRPSPFNTFATLQSKELTLARLEREERISSLSAERARKRVEEVLEKYSETIVFRIHLFIGADRVSTPYSPLQQRVVATLHVDGDRTYESVRTEKSSVEFENRGGSGVYRFPILAYFDRHVNGRDLLTDSEKWTLSIRPFPDPTELTFGWRRAQ